MDHRINDTAEDKRARRYIAARARLLKGWRAAAAELGLSKGKAYHIAAGRLAVPAHIREAVEAIRRNRVEFRRAARWLAKREVIN